VALPQETWNTIDSIAQASRANGEDANAEHSSVLYNLVMGAFALMEQVEQLVEPPGPTEELNIAHSGGTVETQLRLVSTNGVDPHDYIDAEDKKQKDKEEKDGKQSE